MHWSSALAPLAFVRQITKRPGGTTLRSASLIGAERLRCSNDPRAGWMRECRTRRAGITRAFSLNQTTAAHVQDGEKGRSGTARLRAFVRAVVRLERQCE